MKKRTRIISGLMAATMFVGLGMGTTEVMARSSTRAAWNNAAGDAKEEITLNNTHSVETNEDGNETTVQSNVYADSTKWAAWQKNWSTIKNNYYQVALTPGKNATELNFAWYSSATQTPRVKLMNSNGVEINTFTGTQSAASDDADVKLEGVSLNANKVTVTGLQENTSYKYQYSTDGEKWSEVYTYSTESTDKFSVMYVGDPQIGASTNQLGGETPKEYYAMNDAYNWNQTLENAVNKFPNLAFLLSAGDQINQTSVGSQANNLEQQVEYAGFLSAEELRSLPIATTIGNHDSKSSNYSNHFNYPNASTTTETTAGKTEAGTDYYFRYGNTLFVSIDTNNYNCATHENVIKKATEENKDATWKVIMFHQDIYGSGYDHSDSDGIVLRTQLTPIIDKYGFDAVLQGHDHTYSRTYQISAKDGEYTKYTTTPYNSGDKNDTKYNTPEYNEYMAQNNCYNLLTGAESLNKVVDPKGAVYFEANSSTGSKYYQMIGTQQNYIAARSQSWRPTYSVLDITETTLTVNTYDAASGDELVADGGIDTTYTIVKSVDKTALNTEMASAQASYDTAKKAGNYTEASLKTLEDTLTAAKAVLENEEAGTTEIASAITSLQDAVKGLTVKTATVIADTTSANTTEDVQSALLAAIATSTGEIDATIPKDTTVTKTVMEAAKAAGLKAIYHSDAKSKVTWKFNSITTPKDFNPEVTVGTKIAAVDSALKKLSVPKTTKLTEVEFAFDGELPGTAEVTLDLSEAGFTDNSKVYLYYCNEEKGEFELAGEATYKAGEATFEITHCSNYVVSNEKLPAANTSLKSVQAGDNSPVAMILWFALGLTGMAGVGAVGFTEYKRKKNMNGEAE